MARCVAFVRLLSDESGVSQQDCKKVLDGLSKVLVANVKESGCCRIPNILIVTKSTYQEGDTRGREESLWEDHQGSSKARATSCPNSALKKLKDGVLPA